MNKKEGYATSERTLLFFLKVIKVKSIAVKHTKELFA